MSMCRSGFGDDEFTAIVRAAASQGESLARRLCGMGIFEPLYLSFRASTSEASGALKLVRVSDEVPAGWELAQVEPLSISVPFDNYRTWICERSMRLPVLRTVAVG